MCLARPEPILILPFFSFVLSEYGYVKRASGSLLCVRLLYSLLNKKNSLDWIGLGSLGGFHLSQDGGGTGTEWLFKLDWILQVNCNLKLN